MKRIAGVLAVVLLVAGALVPTAGADSGLEFSGGIGVNPVSNVVGTAATGDATRNVVRGVLPGGQPWVIAKLQAEVEDYGKIKVEGKGLLLAGGDGIGTTGGQSVFATLFCGPTAHSTDPAGVLLAPNGDFAIEDVLSPTPPAYCEAPALLIRNVAGRWFAAGIPADRDK